MTIKTSHQQGVRLFMSLDLVGSTAVKLEQEAFRSANSTTRNAPTPDAKEGRRWVDIVFLFFSMATETLERRTQQEFDREQNRMPQTPMCKAHVWRIAGDELLFFTSRLEDPRQIAVLCRAFNYALSDLDAFFLERYGMGVKGVAWAAGFPNRNIEIGIDRINSPHVIDMSALVATGSQPLWENSLELDFLGPEIDLGFRLSQLACPRRQLISIDVAKFVAEEYGHFERRPRFFLVGWAKLKGLYRETPYPLIWIDYYQDETDKRIVRRNSFEESASTFCERYLSGSGRLEVNDILSLHADYLRDTADFRIDMYLTPTRNLIPAPHQQFHIKEIEN